MYVAGLSVEMIMRSRSSGAMAGFTAVELMVTILVSIILAVGVGTFLAKLLAIQEKDRESAYVREQLTDICALYANALSLASSFGTRDANWTYGNEVITNQEVLATYRQETGGVSMETGVVSHVAYVLSSVDVTNRAFTMRAFAQEFSGWNQKKSSSLRGDAQLIPLVGDLVSWRIRPVLGNADDSGAIDINGDHAVYQVVTNAALGLLEVTARYATKDRFGRCVTNAVSAERVVRLWNHE